VTPSLQDIVKALEPRAMVQIVVITAGGQKYALFGPVMGSGDVTEIEFGELLPMEIAAKMLSGEHRRWLGDRVQ